MLDDGKTLPIRAEGVRRTDTGCTVRLTLYEGRYRQIHRMLEHCGPYRVKGLQRVAMGPLTVVGLPRGQARHLEAFEVERLKQASTSRARSTGSQTKPKQMKPRKTKTSGPHR
jgi:23S rRNA pseudouridine2605 synthase